MPFSSPSSPSLTAGAQLNAQAAAPAIRFNVSNPFLQKSQFNQVLARYFDQLRQERMIRKAQKQQDREQKRQLIGRAAGAAVGGLTGIPIPFSSNVGGQLATGNSSSIPALGAGVFGGLGGLFDGTAAGNPFERFSSGFSSALQDPTTLSYLEGAGLSPGLTHGVKLPGAKAQQDPLTAGSPLAAMIPNAIEGLNNNFMDAETFKKILDLYVQGL